jgi:AraC family transcriptional regulator, arabinose operon regulatory protein
MDPRVARVLEQLENRVHEPLTIRALAAGLGLSPSRFSHLFRDEVGASPMRYLQSLRMTRAMVLLERTSFSVREVMVQVGYNDPSHFARDFRRHHGVGPRDLRTLTRTR